MLESESMDSSDKLYTPGLSAIDVSPDQDKGVLKTILTEGEGEEFPQTGNNVFVHYVGKLLDGTHFDSSRDRDTVFEFILGKGNVIKAWDIGVATMKKGEKCILTCCSDYAYGKSGSPPKIPADATLVFEVELLKWSLEDLSNKSDNGVQRSIIKAGEGSDMPNDEAKVTVHLIGKHSGKVFEDKKVTFQLGEGEEHGIVNGLEIALKHFKKDEVSKIILAPNYAFGAKGNPELNIPPNSEIEYEVTLLSFEKKKVDTKEKEEQAFIKSENLNSISAPKQSFVFDPKIHSKYLTPKQVAAVLNAEHENIVKEKKKANSGVKATPDEVADSLRSFQLYWAAFIQEKYRTATEEQRKVLQYNFSKKGSSDREEKIAKRLGLIKRYPPNE